MRLIGDFRREVAGVKQPYIPLVSCWIVFSNPFRNDGRIVVAPSVPNAVAPLSFHTVRAIIPHMQLGPRAPGRSSEAQPTNSDKSPCRRRTEDSAFRFRIVLQ